MMYDNLPGFVFGFHGCDQSVYDAVVKNQQFLNSSQNSYDWLGHGIYFWESNLQRAYAFAEEQKNRCKIKDVAVIGAVIDLGYCLNLVDSRALQIVKGGYELLKSSFENIDGNEMPVNLDTESNTDLLLRHLDCAVIQMVHQYNKKEKLRSYDSVRGLFLEGEPLYPNAGFREKNHIQICIRNPNCIKGFFSPLDPNDQFDVP